MRNREPRVLPRHVSTALDMTYTGAPSPRLLPRPPAASPPAAAFLYVIPNRLCRPPATAGGRHRRVRKLYFGKDEIPPPQKARRRNDVAGRVPMPPPWEGGRGVGRRSGMPTPVPAGHPLQWRGQEGGGAYLSWEDSLTSPTAPFGMRRWGSACGSVRNEGPRIPRSTASPLDCARGDVINRRGDVCTSAPIT